MKIEGEYLFNGPIDEVWKIVRDPEVLATALPGTKSLDKVGENEFVGEMNVRVGPVGGLFSGRLVVANEIPPESCTLIVEGKGGPGFASGTGNVSLVEQGEGKTLMKYDGEAQIGGRLASVGQRVLDTASKSMIRQGLDALDLALQARMAAKAGATDVEYSSPSESEFIATVAKDVAGEMLSSSRAIWIAIAILVIIAVIAVIWFSVGPGI